MWALASGVLVVALAVAMPHGLGVETVGIFSADDEGDVARIVGSAEFGASDPVSWPDAPEDTFGGFPGDPAGRLGVDLTGASIRWADSTRRELEFRFELRNLTEPTDGAPESVLYLWGFSVDGRDPLGVWAMRSSQFQEPGSTAPVFRLISCEGGHSFAGSCGSVNDPEDGEVAELEGRFDGEEDAVVVYVPFRLIAAEEGSAVDRGVLFPNHLGGQNISTHLALASGGSWVFDPLDAMTQTGPFVIPTREVEVAVVDPALPPEDIESWSGASVADDGTFEGTVDVSGYEPGTYTAWARACLGPGNCGLADEPIEIS